ncbi:MAG: hypothetical protein ACT6UU_24675, partial [Hydrogenophaga sp.]
ARGIDCFVVSSDQSLLRQATQQFAANASKRNEEAEARAAKEDARRALEAAWRWAVLEATWAKVKEESANQSSGPKLDEITRHMALRNASGLNQDNAKRLCKLLELGKVAPKDGLLDWVRTTSTPGAAMLLLIMFAEVEYQHWRDGDQGSNKGLFLVAEAFGVDKDAIEAQTRANTRAAKASEKKPAKGEPGDPPAAQASGVRGAKAGKTKPSAAPAAKKSKTSPEEAMQGIAAAMQGAEEAAAPTAADPGAADAAQRDEGAADDGRVDQGDNAGVPLAGFVLGQVVRFRDNLKSAGGKRRKVSGLAGTIESVIQPGRYMVRYIETSAMASRMLGMAMKPSMRRISTP